METTGYHGPNGRFVLRLVALGSRWGSVNASTMKATKYIMDGAKRDILKADCVKVFRASRVCGADGHLAPRRVEQVEWQGIDQSLA